MLFASPYRGRFAPSPTGPLHFGSLVAAVGSYLEAKEHKGIWLVRMEDLDTPRTVAGAADDILRTLEAFGLQWDGAVLYQSQRAAAYEEALHELQRSGMVYPCACTRKEIADSALHGVEGFVYPGTCRNGMHPHPLQEGSGMAATRVAAWRVRTNINQPVRPEPVEGRTSHFGMRGAGFDKLSPNGLVQFNDLLQGRITQHLENEIGDFVVKRADGLFAYQLAVVVDDAFQGITHIVRGADLLASTPRQIYLQRLQGLPTPHYMHLPVAVNEAGEKLSKQTLAASVDRNNPADTLLRALVFLRQEPPAELGSCKPEKILDWAIAHWDKDRLKKTMQLPAG